MNFSHLLPKEFHALWNYYQPTKDKQNVLLDSLPWERLCAWYYIFGYSRITDKVLLPEVLINELFREIEFQPEVFCSAFAAAVISERSDLVVDGSESALRALGWYYLFGIRELDPAAEFLYEREAALASKLISANPSEGAVLAVIRAVQVFATKNADLAVISGDPLITLGWLFCEHQDHPFFSRFWHINTDFFFSERANSLFGVNDVRPLIVVCVDRYQKHLSPEYESSAFEWKRWLEYIAPVLFKKISGFRLSGGVNLVGPATIDSGMGEDLRSFASVLLKLNIPFTVIRFPDDKIASESNRELEKCISNCFIYDITLLCMTPEEAIQLLFKRGRGVFEGRHTIGFFPVELRDFPSQLRLALDLVSEVWCMTSYVQNGLPIDSGKKGYLMPSAIRTLASAPATDRCALGLPVDGFVFLCCFDALSYFERKNPFGVIEAFIGEFSESKNTYLVLKTMNLDRAPEAFKKRLTAHVGGNVILIDSILSRKETEALIINSDALVSLHRAEGFGRVLGEAMCLGVPLIASRYSGSTDFANDETAFMVDGDEVAVPEGAYPYGVGNYWFEPSIESARKQMRLVYEMRGTNELRNKTERAKAMMAMHHSIESLSARVEKRLSEIFAERIHLPDENNEIFDSKFYAGMSPDLNSKWLPKELLQHYCTYGILEGRSATRTHFNRKHHLAREKRSVARKVAVIIHCYYVDQIQELARYIANLSFADQDIFVNLVDRPSLDQDKKIVLRALPTAKIFVGQNRGRDVGGLLNVLCQIDRNIYDVCLVIHTKSSPQNKGLYSTVWREDLLGSLLRDPETAYRNLNAFREYGSRVGAIGTLNWRSESVCGNANHVARLFERLGVSENARPLEYISGTMMFIRMSILNRVVGVISQSEFELCDGKPREFFIDGQMEHALERVLGSVIKDEGLTIRWVQ